MSLIGRIRTARRRRPVDRFAGVGFAQLLEQHSTLTATVQRLEDLGAEPETIEPFRVQREAREAELGRRFMEVVIDGR